MKERKSIEDKIDSFIFNSNLDDVKFQSTFTFFL